MSTHHGPIPHRTHTSTQHHARHPDVKRIHTWQAQRFRLKFIPNVFTPAQVEQLCAEHDTIDDFMVGLEGLSANEY